MSDLYIKDYEELVQANGSGKETLFRYNVVKNRVEEFMMAEYKVTDLPLDFKFGHFSRQESENGCPSGWPFRLKYLSLR